MTVLGMYVELGDQVMANQPSDQTPSDRTPYNSPSAAGQGQSQGQSVNPQSSPPDSAQPEASSEATPIPIGVPMSPEEYRELKERATRPAPSDQENSAVDAQSDSVSTDTDESEQ